MLAAKTFWETKTLKQQLSHNQGNWFNKFSLFKMFGANERGWNLNVGSRDLALRISQEFNFFILFLRSFFYRPTPTTLRFVLNVSEHCHKLTPSFHKRLNLNAEKKTNNSDLFFCTSSQKSCHVICKIL